MKSIEDAYLARANELNATLIRIRRHVVLLYVLIAVNTSAAVVFYEITPTPTCYIVAAMLLLSAAINCATLAVMQKRRIIITMSIDECLECANAFKKETTDQPTH